MEKIEDVEINENNKRVYPWDIEDDIVFFFQNTMDDLSTSPDATKETIHNFKSDNEIWCEKLEEVTLFFKENERRPSKFSHDQKERELHEWLSSQLFYRGKYNWEPEIENIWQTFKQNHIQFFKSNEDQWLTYLDKIKTFLTINKRRPLKIAIDKDETMLHCWMMSQIRNRPKCCQIMAKEEIRNIWDIFVNNFIEYFKSQREIWHEKFNKLKLFVIANKRRPSRWSGGQYENKLGCWIQVQTKNREKCSCFMVNEEIRAIWDEFKEKYRL